MIRILTVLLPILLIKLHGFEDMDLYINADKIVMFSDRFDQSGKDKGEIEFDNGETWPVREDASEIFSIINEAYSRSRETK
jgi:hypothetical protein